MEKKRGRPAKMKKKLGRPRKIRQVDDEGELQSSSSEGDDNTIHQTGPYSYASSPGLASASLDTPTIATCQTRQAKALADNGAAFKTPSIFPFQNNDQKPTQNSTLLLVKQILIDENRLEANRSDLYPSESSVQDQDLHSQHESICSAKITGAEGGAAFSSKTENRSVISKNVLDLKKFTSDLLAQTQGPDSSQSGLPCSEEIIFNNNPSEMEANVVPNIFPDSPMCTADIYALVDNESSKENEVMPKPENSFVDVDGYKVKMEVVPLLKAIFTKYGDIAKESTFSVESRSCLLELVCSIYKRLEVSKLLQLTPMELQSMVGQIGDLELVNVNIGWLHKRLNLISKATQLCEGAMNLENAKARTSLLIYEKLKALETYEKELEASMAAVKKLHQTLREQKDELALLDEIKNFFDRSLVHGLI